MPKRETSEASFADALTDLRRAKLKNVFLRQIDTLVDWRPIRTLLDSKYTKHQNAVGNLAYRLWFGGGVCRYRGLAKTSDQILLDAMWHTPAVYNLTEAKKMHQAKFFNIQQLRLNFSSTL